MAASELRRFEMRVLRDVLAGQTGQPSIGAARFSFLGQGATVSVAATIPTGSSQLHVFDAGALLSGSTVQVGLNGKSLSVTSVDSRTLISVSNSTGSSISVTVGTRLILTSDAVTVFSDAAGTPISGGNTLDTGPGSPPIWIGRPVVDYISTSLSGYDATTAATQPSGSGSALSWSHTASGSNRLVLVAVSWQEGTGTEDIDSVTYGGIAMTLVDSTIMTSLYSLMDPPTGSKTVVVNWTGSGSKTAVAGAVSFAGVDRDHPLDATVKATGNSTAPSVSIPAGDISRVILTFVGVNCASSVPTLTAGTGLTQRWNDHSGTTGATLGGGATADSAGGAQTLAWTLSSARNWSTIAVGVRSAQRLEVDLAAANVPSLAYVDARNYPNLQDAVDSVAIGGTLNIPNGDYVVPDGGLVINKSICLQGDPGTRLFSFATDGDQPVIRIVPGGVPIQGITIRDLTLLNGSLPEAGLTGNCGILCDLPTDGSKVSRLVIERVITYDMGDDGISLVGRGTNDSFFVFVSLRDVSCVNGRGRGLFASYANLLNCYGCYFAANDLEGVRCEVSEPALYACSVENNCLTAFSRKDPEHLEDRFALDPDLGGQLVFLNCGMGRIDAMHVESFNGENQPLCKRGIVLANSKAITVSGCLFINGGEDDLDAGILITGSNGSNSSPVVMACTVLPNWFSQVKNAVVVDSGATTARDCVVFPQHISSGTGALSLPTAVSDSGIVSLGNRKLGSSGLSRGIFVPPRVNSAGDPLPSLTSTEAGYMLFDTTTATLRLWTGSAWLRVSLLP